MKVVNIKEKQSENVHWPIDCCLAEIDKFEEIVVLAKVKGEERYMRFTTVLKSTFWWTGVLEVMKRNLMRENVTSMDVER